MKTLKLTASLLSLILLASSSLALKASGVITISGKLNSITPKYFLIETPKAIYFIDKTAVLPSQAKKMTKTEVPVSVSIPMEAVDRVKLKDIMSRS